MAKKKSKKELEELTELTGKCEEYLAGWKRALADYENLKQSVDRQLADGRERIKTSFAEDLLPVIDNFDQLKNHTPETDDPTCKTWIEGVQIISKQFEEAMQSMGAEKIKTVGEQFDPNLHEAAGSRSESNKEDQEILEEVQSGWKIGERTIRPSKVIINQIKGIEEK